MPHILTLSWKSMNDKDFSSTKGTSNDSDQGDGAISHRPDKIHLETRARLERYKAIAQQCHALQIKDLFVGHHAGDQVETVIFRFSRASGIDGLAGIQDMTLLGVVHVAEALDIRVIRPLLNVSKWCMELMTPKYDSSFYLVKPWLRDIWFDSDNGVCHIKLQTAPVPNNIAASTNMGWLQESETHVATRILSFLVRWVNCKDHSPRLEDIQTLLNHLRQPPVESSSSIPGPPVPAIEHEDDASSTVYRRKKTRASKHRLGMRQTAQSQDPGYVMNDQRAELSTTLLTRQPVNIAGVLFTPPRKTKGVLDHWTLSRQPMSSAEQLAASVCADLDTQVDLVWDQRFFIRIEPSPGLPGSAMSLRQSHLRVRPLAASDVPTIQRLLETDPQHGEDSNKLKTWMFIVSGKVRFTIPVICYMEEHSLRTDELNPSTNTKFGRRGSLSERVVSLPTLGINMFPSGLVTKSWFKSNAPADARDIRDYLLCETRKGQ
ncbi:PP-loop family-domain-containing protein [Gamsiella multidivaricata]|uniref:PP-loop family-domain-containing protein n=1 Tax=Gamsiella multidivaricata TaxID=101098 RepID=UPI002220D51E|nr:PP-loop family-domain-containing protein [Gamsiella multidivaricata]KAI7828684.1 PP-loop family-domain-containing protein [Gamsiella multidivaricata]